MVAAVFLLILAAAVFAKDRLGSSTAFVASTDLPKGHVLSADDLRQVTASASLIPEAAVSATADLAGRELISAMNAGEVFTASRLDAPTDTRSADLRTVSVPIPDRGTLAMLHPGAIVDIFSAPPTMESGASRALATGVQVTEVPRDSRGESAGTVAIQVPAGDAATVAAAALEQPVIIVFVE